MGKWIDIRALENVKQNFSFNKDNLNEEQLTIRKTKVEIKKEDAELFHKLFKKALQNGNSDLKGSWVPDSDAYYFYVNDYGTKSGVTWSSNKGSKMKKLLYLTKSLIRIANKEKEIIEFTKDFTSDTKTLMEKFN